jgi:hypothetical protein
VTIGVDLRNATRYRDVFEFELGEVIILDTSMIPFEDRDQDDVLCEGLSVHTRGLDREENARLSLAWRRSETSW